MVRTIQESGIRNLLSEIIACYRSKHNEVVVRDPHAVFEKIIFPGIHMDIFGNDTDSPITNYNGAC